MSAIQTAREKRNRVKYIVHSCREIPVLRSGQKFGLFKYCHYGVINQWWGKIIRHMLWGISCVLSLICNFRNQKPRK